MKSYLKGNPELKLALNDDLTFGRGNSNTNAPCIDDYNFHENASAYDFEMSKTMRIKPPEGEFVLMNYRVTGDFNAPFRLFPFIEEPTNYRLELNLRIKSMFGKDFNANNVIIKFPVPRSTSNVHCELPKVKKLKASFLMTRELKAKRLNFKLQKIKLYGLLRNSQALLSSA